MDDGPGGVGTGGSARRLIIHNSRSRRGRSAALRVRARLDREGPAGPALWVEVQNLARMGPPEGPIDRAIAVGGDGTVSAAAEWLLLRGPADRSGGAAGAVPAPALAVVPAGTGNNLARTLGLPLQAAEAIAVALLGGKRREIDVVRCRHLDRDGAAAPLPPPRFILQGAGWGFPAEIAASYDALRRHGLFRVLAYPLGGGIYRLLALAGLLRKVLRECRRGPGGELGLEVRLPGESFAAEAVAVFAGNDPTQGGGFHPCPRAALDDGLLDLCVVRAGSPGSYPRLFHAVARGSHLRLAGAVEYRQSPGPVELRFSRPAPLLADGDIGSAACGYRLDVLPRALAVVVGR